MTFGRWRLFAAAGAALALMTAGRQAAAQATITGRVTAQSGPGLAESRVLVIGTAISASTSENGGFTLRNVPAGPAQIQVLRVGYKSVKKTVEVPASGTVTADFVLDVAVAQLEEIVTTATGQQRRVELGNAVSTLGDVGKRVEETQISSVSDMLVAKAPGVVVLPGSTLGGAPTVRVRGVSSISLSNAPIYVVDGVRFASGVTGSSGTNTSFSFLNTLNPEEIEDIEIVKGPSAATLYGTDAANGVIVITTKKGRSGAAKWTWSGEVGNVDDRSPYPAMYANWGHTAANPSKSIRCQIATQLTAGCITDSITSYNLLADKSATFIHMGNRNMGGLQVNGGSEAVRYFVSGNLDNETGPIQMPGYEVQRFDSLHVGVRDEWLHPLAQQKAAFRGNMSATVSPKLDLSFNSGFTKTDNRIEPESSLIIALLYTGLQNYGFKGPGLDKVVNQADGTYLHDYNTWAPGDIMQYVNEQDVQRTIGSFNANWRPFSWMQNDGTVGMDLATVNFFHICRLNECPPQSVTARAGNVSDNRQTVRDFSARVASTSTWNARSWANFKTTFGGDYTNLESDAIITSGTTLPPGATTVGAAATFSARDSQPTAVKTLGVYAQEQATFRDRLFLTVAARSDQNSAFGSNFQRVLYPKASISWLASDEGFFPHYSWLSSLRLRSSFGASGVQPGRTSGLVLFSANTVTLATRGGTTGTDTPGLIASNPGNANLKPERSSELESGFETQLLNSRVRIDYTFYNKQTRDALISVPIAGSAGASVTSLLQNVGKTKNTGHEIQVSAQLYDSRRFGWDVTLNGSHNTATVVDLGIDPSTGVARILGAGGTTQNHNGDPINSQWYRPYTYEDKNHDGVLEWNAVDALSEVHVDSVLKNFGNAIPRDLFSVQNGFDLFSHRFRINAMFDYKGGYSTQDGANNFQCNSSPVSCQETQDPHSPLALQARAIAKTYGSNLPDATGKTITSYKTGAGYFMNGQFWKFRELSAVAQLPDRVTHLVRAAAGSNLVFAARNLHTWTSFTGIDPEANYGLNAGEVQNEFQTNAAPTYFTLRLNLKY